MRWLEKEARGRQVPLCIIGFFDLKLAYVFLALGIAYFLNFDVPPVNREPIPIFTFSFPIILLLGVFAEEVIFRLPLAIAVELGWSITKILAVAAILSIIFGLAHGSIYHVFFQGVGGLIYSVLFLKCGGFQGNYPKAIITTIILHFLYNAVVVLSVIANGATSI